MDWWSPGVGGALMASSMTVVQMVLLGRKNRLGWVLGLCVQPVWAWVEIATGMYGALPLVVSGVGTSLYGLWRWSR